MRPRQYRWQEGATRFPFGEAERERDEHDGTA